MTDLDPTSHATLSCSSCGAQNDGTAEVCARCGTALAGAPGEAGRTDLEVEEVWRGAAAAGFDDELLVEEHQLTCPHCSRHFHLDRARDVAQQTATDTSSGGADIVVITLRCPACDTALRGQLDPEWIASNDETGDRAPHEDDQRREADASVTGEPAPRDPAASWVKTTVTEDEPLGSDVANFAPARPGNLRDQGPLIDETGADIREYTGEPVETGQGWVLPQQQNVGPGNEAGSGEFPDPEVPPAVPDDDAAEDR